MQRAILITLHIHTYRSQRDLSILIPLHIHIHRSQRDLLILITLYIHTGARETWCYSEIHTQSIHRSDHSHSAETKPLPLRIENGASEQERETVYDTLPIPRCSLLYYRGIVRPATSRVTVEDCPYNRSSNERAWKLRALRYAFLLSSSCMLLELMETCLQYNDVADQF